VKKKLDTRENSRRPIRQASLKELATRKKPPPCALHNQHRRPGALARKQARNLGKSKMLPLPAEPFSHDEKTAVSGARRVVQEPYDRKN
jgi:hypothetical protein